MFYSNYLGTIIVWGAGAEGAWEGTLKIELIEVPDSEYDSMGCNVLAIGHKKVVMVDGNSITKNLIEEKGIEVFTYDGTEISLKGAGGPTCLTRPFLRTSL